MDKRGTLSMTASLDILAVPSCGCSRALEQLVVGKPGVPMERKFCEMAVHDRTACSSRDDRRCRVNKSIESQIGLDFLRIIMFTVLLKQLSSLLHWST